MFEDSVKTQKPRNISRERAIKSLKKRQEPGKKLGRGHDPRTTMSALQIEALEDGLAYMFKKVREVDPDLDDGEVLDRAARL